MSELVPCTACARHIRSRETACPFCGIAATPTPARAESEPRAPLRLSRAALALAGMTALTACGKQPDTTAAAYGGPPPTANTDMAKPAYGGPPPMMVDAEPPPPLATDAGSDAGKDAGKEAGTAGPKPTPNNQGIPAPAYGGPPPKR
jgi:hypothetical protein